MQRVTVNFDQLVDCCTAHILTLSMSVPQSSPNRTFKFTARYAAAVRSIASQLSLPLLDVWKLFTQQQGWQQLLRTDGLHLNLDGQKAVFEELMKVVEHDVASVRCVRI